MNKKLIYIAGYGRSGSTILDIMLSNSSNVNSAGALSNILEWILYDNFCACGKKMSECEYWENYKYISQNKIDREHLLSIQKKSERFYLPIFKFNNSKVYSKYLQDTYNYVLRGNNNVIVDSSKTSHSVLFRPYLAKKNTDFDVKIVFLKRNFSGVLESNMKKHGSPEREKNRSSILTFLITVISYVYTYLFTHIIYQAFSPESRIIVRFNDLKNNPKKVLNMIGNKFEVDVTDPVGILEEGRSFTIQHMVGGNRIRFNNKIKFRKN